LKAQVRAETAPRQRATHPLLQRIEFPERDVKIWQAHLDAASISEVEDLRCLLEVKECERAERFRFEQDRARFIVAHGLLRHLLSGVLECSAVSFKYGLNGKPALVQDHELQFNLSHSADWAVFALAWRCRVGIDLESAESLARNPADLPALAERIFSSAELTRWRALSAQEASPAAFLRAWTRKEACLKAAGLRLDDMASIETSFDETNAPRDILVPASEGRKAVRLQLHDISVLMPLPSVCALAIEAG
jgi:4'-phosphopantetheinyl transferase